MQKGQQKPQIPEERGAKCGAPEAVCPKETGPADALDGWLRGCPLQLSDAQRAAVVGIVQGGQR
jgi:hypothetical protein